MSITTSQRYALTRLATAVPFIVVLLVYVPAVGHGFISDDFRWIIESRIAHFSDVPSIFSRNTGFYRPLVALTFSADYAAFGNHSLAYGLTNLVFALTSAMLISVLIRDLELPWGAAALGAALWLLNFHGTAMGILWISGRTALLLVLTGVATAIAIVRRKIVIAALLLFAALLAKEEAIVLPFIMLVWIVLLRRRPRARQIHPAAWISVSGLAVITYLLLRARSGAFTPASAPSYYRFVFGPGAVADNILEYADRTLTLSIAVCIIAFVFLRPLISRVSINRNTVMCGITWIVGGYALTLFLPVRSSLYACFPSVGASIIAAALCAAFWRQSDERHQSRALTAAVLIPILLIPVYRSRNHRWVDLAEFSASILKQFEMLTRRLPDDAHVVLVDERDQRVNLEAAFGTLINDACRLQTERSLDVSIEPQIPRVGLAGVDRRCSSCDVMMVKLHNGTLLLVN